MVTPLTRVLVGYPGLLQQICVYVTSHYLALIGWFVSRGPGSINFISRDKTRVINNSTKKRCQILTITHLIPMEDKIEEKMGDMEDEIEEKMGDMEVK